jgi:hypothetical protein
MDVRQQKTGKFIAVPLHPELAKILAATPTAIKPTFLMTEYANPFTAAGFGGWFRERCKEAGLPNECTAHGPCKAAARPRVSQDNRRRGIGRPSRREPRPCSSWTALDAWRAAGSGGKRAPDTEPVVVVPVVGGVPVAVGRAEVLWIVVPLTAAKDTATRGRPGFRGYGRVKPMA